MFLLLCFARSSCRRTWAGQGHTGTGTVSVGLPSQNLAGPTRQADPEQAACRQGLINPNLPQSEGYK